MIKNRYTVIGIMSGTSMDGLDLACCEFVLEADKWKYAILAAETIPYEEKWVVRLTNLHKQPSIIYPKTDLFYGKYIGQCVNRFIKKYALKPEFISSHGHTIFHQPDIGLTAQIGNGAAIHAETGLPVVYDFRTGDVMLGGQGAPLVPIGDKLLFQEFDACLNLGGIANISFTKNNKRVAFDISPCNILLNRIARNKGLQFDNHGEIAKSGKLNEKLLQLLNDLPYYKLEGVKSLGVEWIDETCWPLIMEFEISDEDMLATLTEHIVKQISLVVSSNGIKSILVTGGGAHNHFLTNELSRNSGALYTIPDEETVDFKEALIFAFLGVLRVRGEINILKEVTGAKRDSIGGVIEGVFSEK